MILRFFQGTAKTVSCMVSNHMDTTSNSASAIDFSVDLSDFDINIIPEEVRKLHEEGRLKKLLQQAMELRRSKTGMSSALFSEQRYLSSLIFDITIMKLRQIKIIL